MDEIRIENLEVYAYHGVFPEEREQGQPFYVNACLYCDLQPAGETDDLTLSTHYGEVCHLITRWMQENTCQLIETVAERVAEAILLGFPGVEALDLEIRKPEAPIGLPFGCVSVKIHRGWHRAYLSIGSNMGDREAYLNRAVHTLGEHPKIRVEKVSSYLRTAPYGGVEQEDFLNGAVQIRTLLSPGQLLVVLHEVEAAAGRERLIRWGPRTLDLDILYYDKLILESEELTIPHVDMENRSFVLKPLCELAPTFHHPVSGKTTTRMLQELEDGTDSVKE